MIAGVDRVLVPEMLDALPPEASEARASRRDLRRINAIMLQTRIMAALLRTHVPAPPRTLVDLGSGDGHGALRLARALSGAWPEVTLTLLDARPAVPDAVRAGIEATGWRVEVAAADVFDWLGRAPPHDVAVANLFVHHFEGAALARLLRAVAARAGVFVATEPRRGRIALLASRAVGAIGANAVTCHDAPASVRAGFAGAELSALWPGWVLAEGPRAPFTHVFAASSEGLA